LKRYKWYVSCKFGTLASCWIYYYITSFLIWSLLEFCWSFWTLFFLVILVFGLLSLFPFSSYPSHMFLFFACLLFLIRKMSRQSILSCYMNPSCTEFSREEVMFLHKIIVCLFLICIFLPWALISMWSIYIL